MASYNQVKKQDFDDQFPEFAPNRRREGNVMSNALDVLKDMYPDTQPMPEDLEGLYYGPDSDVIPTRPLPSVEFLNKGSVNDPNDIISPPGAPPRGAVKRKIAQGDSPAAKRVLTYDDQPQDQKRMTSETVETLQTVCPTIPNMDDSDFADFVRMLDSAEDALKIPAKQPEPERPKVITIPDDVEIEPTILDMTLTFKEVMLVDVIQGLEFKEIPLHIFLSPQKLTAILPSEDDPYKRANIMALLLLHHMLDRGLYCNDFEFYDVPKPAEPLLMHHEIHPGKLNLRLQLYYLPATGDINVATFITSGPMYQEDDIYTPVVAEHASSILIGGVNKCSRGKWHSHKITLRPGRYGRGTGNCVSRTEFPTWRKRVWQHLIQYYPERRACRGCVVLAGRSVRNWSTQCPVCGTVPAFASNPNEISRLVSTPSDTRLCEDGKDNLNTSSSSSGPSTQDSRQRRHLLIQPGRIYGTQGPSSKVSPMERYRRLLKRLSIKNDKMYDMLISTNNELQEAEFALKPNEVNNIKRLVLNQNTHLPYLPLVERILDVNVSDPIMTAVFEKAFTVWFSTIATENNISSESVLKAIVETDPKISTLIFIGASNSGKSFLSAILTAAFEDYELGIIQSVSGRPGDFWLQDCLGKELYVCEELVLSTIDIIQRFKAVMEGNCSLDTNVKYCGNKSIPRRPFIVTMNGDVVEDVCFYFPTEFSAINNRCHIFNMQTELTRLIPSNILTYIMKHKEFACKYLINLYLSRLEDKEGETEMSLLIKYIA